LLTKLQDERAKEILTFMPILRTELDDFIGKACEEKVTLTTQQIKDLSKLWVIAIRQTKKVALRPETVHDIWNPACWDEYSKTLSTAKPFKGSSALLTMCKQMARSSQIAIAAKDSADKVPTKRKVGDLDGGEEEPKETKEVKRKKIKKNKS
jgi:DNA polymerase phi